MPSVPAGEGVRPRIVIAGVVATVVLWLAYDDGSYQLASRATLAIVVWWAVILGVALSLFGGVRIPRATWASRRAPRRPRVLDTRIVARAPSVEAAFDEFNRVALYLGVYVLVVLAATRGTVLHCGRRACDCNRRRNGRRARQSSLPGLLR